MVLNSAKNESTKPVEIEIKAKDSASKIVKDTGVAFAKLKDESLALSKGLNVAGDSLKTVANLADITRLKVTEASTVILGLGAATAGTLGLAVSKLTGLTSVVGTIKNTLTANPVANSFISVIAAQAEAAVSDVANLSDTLRSLGTVAVPFGEGFTREFLKLDTTPVSQKISESVSQGVRGVTSAVFKPLEATLGFSVISSTQKAIGTALKSLDKSLADNAINSFFDATLGKGTARALIEDFVKSPAIAQYSPDFLKALFSGSVTGAIDTLTGDISKFVGSNLPKDSPLANLITGTGFGNQIENLAGTEVKTVFQKLNNQLADFTLESRIIDIIGNRTSSSFIKGILKQPLITNILKPTVQALATGNFTEAIALSLEQSLSNTINNIFETANKKIAQISNATGRLSLTRLLDGGAKRKAEDRLKELKDGLEEERKILEARRALIQNDFKLDESILLDEINKKQRKLQNTRIDEAEKIKLEASVVALNANLEQLRLTQNKNLSAIATEFKAYETKAKGFNSEIQALEKFLGRSNQVQGAIGDTFSGVGERFLKGLGFGDGKKISITNKLIPFIGTGLSDALDKIFPELNETTSELIKKITKIQPLDNLLGSAIANIGGKSIDKSITKLLTPVVNGTIDTLLDGLQEGGGRNTAKSINRYLPEYLQNVGNIVIDGVRGTGSKIIAGQIAKFFPPLLQGAVAEGLQNSGITKTIFNKIFENLNPQILKTNLQSLDKSLGSLSASIVGSMSKIEVGAIKLLYGIQGILISTVGIIPRVQSVISSFATNINTALDKLQVNVVNIYGKIVNATSQASASTINLFTKVDAFLERLKSSSTSEIKITAIESIQTGIKKATDAVGFLQAKILDIADAGLDFSFSGIEKFRDFVGSVDRFSKNIIPNIKTGISIAFDLAIASVDKLNILALKTLQSAVKGIENLKKTSPEVIDFLINGISKIQGILANVLLGFDSIIGKIIDAGKLDIGAFDFLSQARVNLQGLAKNIDQELEETRRSLRLSKLKNIVTDILINGMKEGGIKELAKTINSVMPGYVQNIGNLLIDGVRGTGSKYTAKIISGFFPESARSEIAKRLQETGLSSKIFDGIFNNINPTNISSALSFIDAQLETIKPIVKPLFENFEKRFDQAKVKIKDFTASTQSFFVSTGLNIITSIQGFISNSIGKINNVLDGIESSVIRIINGINSVTRDSAKSLIDSFTRIGDLITSLKVGQSGFKLTFLETIESAVTKAIAAIGFLQAKIQTLANNGLNSVLDAIDALRESLNTIAETSENILPILEGIFNKFKIAVFGVFGAIKKSAIDAFNAFPENLAKVLVVLRSQVENARNALAAIFSGIDKVLEKIIDSGKISVSAFDFLNTARTKVSGFAESLRKSADDTADSAEENKQKFLDLATSIQGTLVNSGQKITDFAASVKRSLAQTRQDAVNGVDTALPLQIVRLYRSIDGVIKGVVKDGLFSPEVIENNIQKIRDAIGTTIPKLDEFSQKISQKSQQIRNGLNKIFGDTAENFGNLIANLFDSDTEDETAIRIRGLFAPFKDVFQDLFRLTNQQAKRSFLAGILGEGFDRIAPALDLIDRSILRIYQSVSSVAKQTSFALDIFSLIPGKFAGFNEPLAVFGYFEKTVGSVVGGISFLSEKLAFFSQGLSALQQLTSNGPFRLLIGQTVELREQLLATQASLVGTSQIFNRLTGEAIKDPTKAIKALDLPILNQIEALRRESLELVGVTSKDLVPLFQQVASKITSIGGGLTDAKNLSLDFAASLGTLNIPLYQSQQEISSILSAQIDQNSVLAKSLNLTNEQINLYKSQGRLIEELRKRLEAFRAGNKLAAQSLSGITSNIQEIFDEIGRKAGQKLLDPLLVQISQVYDFLLKIPVYFWLLL